MLAAAALVLDNVLVVERLEDLNLPLPAGEKLLAAAGLQRLHGHHLPGAVVGGVIAVQAHFAEVTLGETERGL